jgi:hypothetical protein
MWSSPRCDELSQMQVRLHLPAHNSLAYNVYMSYNSCSSFVQTVWLCWAKYAAA